MRAVRLMSRDDFPGPVVVNVPMALTTMSAATMIPPFWRIAALPTPLFRAVHSEELPDGRSGSRADTSLFHGLSEAFRQAA
jgi:hypothetical protein